MFVSRKIGSTAGVAVYNPAFDVTPHELIAGIITERGVIAPVNAKTIQSQVGVGAM